MKRRTNENLSQISGPISNFVRKKRKQLGYTQIELSQRIGVGLRFLKELEQGKQSLRLDKVDEVLRYFGYTTGPVPLEKQNPFKDNE